MFLDQGLESLSGSFSRHVYVIDDQMYKVVCAFLRLPTGPEPGTWTQYHLHATKNAAILLYKHDASILIQGEQNSRARPVRKLGLKDRHIVSKPKLLLVTSEDHSTLFMIVKERSASKETTLSTVLDS